MKETFIYWRWQKKEVRYTLEAILILGAQSQSNILRPLGHVLLFTNQFLSYYSLPSLELRTAGLLAADVAPSLRSKVPTDCCCHLCLSHCQYRWDKGCSRWWQFSMFWKPAYQTSLPLHSVDDFRVSNCFNFSNKWNKSHSGSSWLLERCTWWTVPRSTCMPPGCRSHCSVCRQKLRCTSQMNLLIHCSFAQDFLWNSLIKESFRMAFIRLQAGVENILLEIPFLRSKSWWKGNFLVLIKTKPNPLLHQSLVRHSLAHLPYLDVLVESETCFDMCFPWVKSNLSFDFMMHVFFFSFVRITSYSILFVFPYLYVHIYLLATVDRYIDRCQASYVLGIMCTIIESLPYNTLKFILENEFCFIFGH